MKTVLEIPVIFATSKRAITLVAYAFFTFLLAGAADAQEIFRWVDKDGKVHYGDMLPPPAEAKDVQNKKLKDSVIEQDAVPYGMSTAMKNNPVVLYATDCGAPCSNGKALLARRGIPFMEKNPQSDPEAAAALKGLSSTPQVPTIMIGANSIQGYEEEGWNSALSAAGYPRNNPGVRQSAAKAGPKDVPPVPAK